MKVISIKRIARDNHIKSKKLRIFALKLAANGKIKLCADVIAQKVYISKLSDPTNAVINLAVLCDFHARAILEKGSVELRRVDGGYVKESGLFNYAKCDPTSICTWVFEKPPTVTKIGLYVPEACVDILVSKFLNKGA